MAIILETSSTTSNTLADKVLQKLGVIAEGESVSSANQLVVDDAYTTVYYELRALHLVDWGYAEAVPNWAMMHIVDIVANRISNVYGIPRSTDEEQYAIQRMSKYLATDYTYMPVQATYY